MPGIIAGKREWLFRSRAQRGDHRFMLREPGPQQNPGERIAAAGKEPFAVDCHVELALRGSRYLLDLDLESFLDLGGETRRPGW